MFSSGSREIDTEDTDLPEVKIFSSSPKHGDGEAWCLGFVHSWQPYQPYQDSDEDFAAASKTGGLRAAGAPENL